MQRKFKISFLLIVTLLLTTFFSGCNNSLQEQIETPPFGLEEPIEELAFGIDDWSKEVMSDKPGETHIRYYTVGKDGVEKTELYVYNMTEEHDLDDDGFKEILMYLHEPKRGIGIYYISADELQYLDVNSELGAAWSEYMGNIGNVEVTYTNCIEVGFQEADKTSRHEVYRFENNTLTYVCSFNDALRL